MGKSDGGLRVEFRHRMPTWQWTSIESPLTAPGAPDSEYCAPGGGQGWIEFKATHAWAVKFRPLQPGWISRRARLGGSVFVAVRRVREALGVGVRGEGRLGPGEGAKAALGPSEGRLGPNGVDELWLYAGGDVVALAGGGLRAVQPLGVWAGGPRKWDWAQVAEILANGGRYGA